MSGEGVLPALRLVRAEPDPEDAAALEAAEVAAARRGDKEAFGSLVRRYEAAIYRLCFRYVSSAADASDLSQEVFVKAYRAIAGFRGESRFSTWLYRIAVNACLNHRSRRRLATEPITDALPARGPGLVERLDRQAQARRVRAAVARLPEKQRLTLLLKVYGDRTHEEVAGILGASVGTVKANLFHALRNLKRLVEEDAAARAAAGSDDA